MADYFDVDPAATCAVICECCGWDVESKQGCQCPECPECGAQGDPNCYRDTCCGGHGMEYNEIQRYGMAKRREMEAEDARIADEMYKEEQWLKATADKGL